MICRMHLRRQRLLTPSVSTGRYPLIEHSIQRASGIVYTVTGGVEMIFYNCNIIFGTVTDAAYEGQPHVTVIATVFADEARLCFPSRWKPCLYPSGRRTLEARVLEGAGHGLL